MQKKKSLRPLFSSHFRVVFYVLWLFRVKRSNCDYVVFFHIPWRFNTDISVKIDWVWLVLFIYALMLIVLPCHHKPYGATNHISLGSFFHTYFVRRFVFYSQLHLVTNLLCDDKMRFNEMCRGSKAKKTTTELIQTIRWKTFAFFCELVFVQTKHKMMTIGEKSKQSMNPLAVEMESYKMLFAELQLHCIKLIVCFGGKTIRKDKYDYYISMPKIIERCNQYKHLFVRYTHKCCTYFLVVRCIKFTHFEEIVCLFLT